MEPITFNETCYWIEDRAVYVNSGEFHYFRVPKADWQRRMELFKAAGGNCLATYIPWLVHEPEEGTFAFDRGDGITDLQAFLQTAADLDLYVVARPGPYQYSELIYGGLPGWLFDRYPDVQAQTIDGEPFGMPSVSYLHPVFLEKTRAWFAAVCPIIARHTISQGGPIAFTQFDNELMGIHIWFGGLDYHPTSMGFGSPAGRYPQFLRRHYENIAGLNKAYGTTFAGFADVRPIAPQSGGRREELLRLRDYFDFYVSATTEYAVILCELMRDHGIDTPFMHNSANPGMNAYFTEIREALGSDFVLGSDHYYNLDHSWPQNNPTPQYARNVFLSCEQLRLMGYPPTIMELPSGSASNWPPITALDAKTCYMTNLAFGMKGHNYYVFTGGPNPPGTGENTDLYDYNAPVGPTGEIRPLYHAQVEFGAFIDRHPGLPQSQRVGDCRIGLDFAYARADRTWRDRGDLLFSPADAWRFLTDGILTSALCASLSPNCVDLGSDAWVKDTGTPVIIVAAETMARDRQMRIVDFLQSGGRVLICPVLPELDGNFQPCTVLSDFLGAPALRPSTNAVTRITIRGPKDSVSNVLEKEAFVTDDLPDGADIVGIDECTGATIAWEIATPGQGRAIVLGMSWEHRMHEHAQAIVALLQRLSVERAVFCSNPNIWTSLRAHEDQALLFLINLFTTPMDAEISCRGPHGDTIDFGRQQVEAMSVKVLEVNN